MPCARRHRSERKRFFSRRSASVIFFRVKKSPRIRLTPPEGAEGPARRKSAAPEPERPQAGRLGIRRWREFLIYVARCEGRDRQWAVTKQQFDQVRLPDLDAIGANRKDWTLRWQEIMG